MLQKHLIKSHIMQFSTFYIKYCVYAPFEYWPLADMCLFSSSLNEDVQKDSSTWPEQFHYPFLLNYYQ